MKVVTARDMQTGPGPEEWFTGKVWRDAAPASASPKEGEDPVEVEAGGVVYFAPDEKHWHGATPETYMVHMALNVATTTDGGTDWLEPVTDEEYGSRRP
jgi:hypothetical protein